MKTQFKSTLLVASLLSLPILAHAASINLNANDGLGSSSFNSGLNWTNGVVPSAANDFNTFGFQMRTPGDGVTAYTFLGASLTLGDHASAGAGNGSILEKFTGGAGSTRTLTINNLTNATGGLLRSGGTAGGIIHIAGNHYTIAGTSAIWADQCIWVIDVPLLGADNVILTNFANNATDHVGYSADNSGFTGSWYLTYGGNGGWSVELDGLNSLPGNPSSPNPGQITFLQVNSQLRDTVGCSYNNSNGGITLAVNGVIFAAATTTIGVPITDLTNGVHSLSSLTSSGTGTLVLSNANNNYAGGTTISAGILQLGVDNAIPGNTVAGNVAVNAATLDLNGHNLIINGLNGNASGVVDTFSGGSPTLTIGANGNNGTFSGNIQNSSGTLSLVKLGAGTQTLAGYSHIGQTLVAGGTLSLNTAGAVPGAPGNLVISNGATVTVDASIGTSLPVSNLVIGTNSTLNATLNSAANGLNVAGNLTFQDNATNTFNYGSLSGNPTALAINAAGSISAPGANIVINITGLGLQPGTFPLIKYTGTALSSIANFSLNLPPGVAGTLENNTGNHSIDVHITSIPSQLSWYGLTVGGSLNGRPWDLSSINWSNSATATLTVYQQYTNGGVIAGDAVRFDDTFTNDFPFPPTPQPDVIEVKGIFSPFPFVVDSSVPYTFNGAGGITGPTSIVKSNTGPLILNTSNSFTGGTFVYGGTLQIANDSALGATNTSLLLNGGNLQIAGNSTNNVRPISMPIATSIGVSAGATARLGGVISGAGALSKTDNGTLILAGRDTFTGNLFGKGGTIVLDSGGSINNGGSYSSIGQSGTDNATLTLKGTGAFTNNADFNVGDIDSSVGTLNIQDTAVLNVNAFWIASANAAGSTASGTLNMSGGTLIQRSTAVGTFDLGGRNTGNAGNGVGILNLSGGYISAAVGIRVGDFGTGTINQNGGLLEVTNNGTGINLRRQSTGVSGTYNLNGGTLRTEKVTSSQTSGTREFYFNGGTLQAGNGNLGTTPFMNSLSHAYIRNGGAVIDSQGYNIIIAQALEHSAVGGDNATDGGLTKLGTGTATLTGVNTFTGSITNRAGTLVFNSASTYAGSVAVNGGTLQISTPSTVQGSTTVTNGTTFTVNQVGSSTLTLGDLRLNGAAALPGATVAILPTIANNPATALVNCGTLTLNGTNSISLPIASVGTIALIKYTGVIAGSGSCTNLILPQGATGSISNDAASSTLFAVITSTGPGIVWTGTNNAAARTNLWDINSSINWVLGSTPTTYRQVIIPGDLVTFNDSGSGTVLLSNSVGPTSLTISNNTKAYTFRGTGSITGPTGIQKRGSGTAILNLANNNYTGGTIVSNGTLQAGSTTAISPSGNAVVGPSGTLDLAGFNQTLTELTGSGIVNNSAGVDLLLTVGSSSGSTWNGSIQNSGGGGIGLIKNGSGTWVVGGVNRLNNGSPFTTTNEFNAGTTIITNGGSILASRLQTIIAYGGGSATVIVDGGTLAVSNDVFAVGLTAGNGTLIVNNGTVFHGGGTGGAFGGPNNIIVGANGSTGVLTVNGGQVLNTQALWLGQNATGSGTLNLNGGLVQATVVAPNAAPATSVANFNGGTLQAVNNSGDFLQVPSMVMSNGLVLDDNGFAVSISSQPLQSGDGFNGGLIKKGAGTVYLDNGNSYTGTTVVTNGTLAGVGSVTGPLVVAPGGTLGAGDAGGIGSFSVNNNLTVQGNASLRIDKSAGTPSQDQVIVSGNIIYGGILIVTNTTSDATPLTTSDTFQLFSVTGTKSGNFAGIAGSPGTGLAYQFTPASGVLSIITQTIATNPTNITFSVSGSTLTLSWPSDHLGWILQSQTNNINVGLSASWFDVLGSGSSTQAVVNINPANPTVFYRLRSP